MTRTIPLSTHLPADLATLADAYGFALEVAGGGALVLSRYWHNGAHLWLTCPDGGGLPTVDAWEIGQYDETGEQVDGWRSDAPSGAPYRLQGAIMAAIRAVNMGLPSTDALTDEFDEWLADNLPRAAVDELPDEANARAAALHADLVAMLDDLSREELMPLLEWLATFERRWTEAQEWEDYKSACEARGEEF